MKIIFPILAMLTSLVCGATEPAVHEMEREFEILSSKPHSSNDAREFREVMMKATRFGHGADQIIGLIPESEALQPGSNYVHREFDPDETSGSTIFNPWRAYKSGPMYYQAGEEICKVRKMSYVRSWFNKNSSNLLFFCYEADKELSSPSRVFKITYTTQGNDVLEIQGNLFGPIGTRTIINRDGLTTY